MLKRILTPDTNTFKCHCYILCLTCQLVQWSLANLINWCNNYFNSYLRHIPLHLTYLPLIALLLHHQMTLASQQTLMSSKSGPKRVWLFLFSTIPTASVHLLMKTSFAIKPNGRSGFYGPGFHQKRQFSAHSLWPKGCCTASFKMLFQIMIMAQLVTGCKVWGSLSPPLLRRRWSRLGSANCDHQTVTNKTEKKITAIWKFKIHKWAVEGSVWIYGIAPWAASRGLLWGAAPRSDFTSPAASTWDFSTSTFTRSPVLQITARPLVMFGCPNICSSGYPGGADLSRW